MRKSFPAMGTEIEAWCGDSAAELEAVRELFQRVESVCSRFVPDSELSRINRAPGPSSHRLSSLMADVISSADTARSSTEGLVDIGVGSAVTGWGYDRSFESIEDRQTGPEPLTAPAWEMRSGMLWKGGDTVLDLGGIAKGWTADRAVEQGMCTVASAGGDLRSAHPETTVTVVDSSDEPAVEVRVGIGALATSSIGRRRWSVGNRIVSHLMDPRTMAPVATPIVSATVVAATAVEAEAGAKAVLLKGEDGLAWADDQAWVRAAIVFWHDGSVFATSGVEAAA